MGPEVDVPGLCIDVCLVPKADIILVDGNPLEDLPLVGGTSSMFRSEPRPTPSVDTIPFVMKDGKTYKKTLN